VTISVRRVVSAVAVAVGCAAFAMPTAHAASKPTFGLPTVPLVTKTSGVGTHPQLRWKPVTGAVSYRVAVLDAHGHAYWSSEVPATTVTVSATGKPVSKTAAAGPRIAKNYQWSVAAFDATGKPIALSAQRRISP
jgi:microcystin-dependent protein